MSLLEALLPTPQTVLYLGNIALAVVWLCAAALLAAFVCRRRSAPARHGLLLLGLVLVFTSPGLVWLAAGAGIGRLQVALTVQRESIEKPDVVPDTLRPTADVPQELTAMERESEWDLRAFVAEHSANVPDTPMDAVPSPRTEPVPPVDHVVTPEETAPATTTPWWWPIARGLALVWALGTAISLLCLVRSFVRLAAFCRGLREHPDDGMRQTAAQAAAQVGLARAPRLLVSAQAVMPVTLGLFRPAVVLPEGFADELPPAQRRAVLLHEMAHVARRDSCVGLAQRLAAALYWWCPPVHWLNRRLADLREEVCDNFVLRNQGDGAALAEVLVALAERVVKPSPLPATVGVSEYRGARERSHVLEHRIRRLLSTETNPMTRMNRAGLALVALMGLGMTVVISLTHVSAAEKDAPKAEADMTKPPARPLNGPRTSQLEPAAVTPADPAAPRKGASPFGPPEAVRADPFAGNNPFGGGFHVEEDDSEQGKVIAEIRKRGDVIRDEEIPGQPVIGVTLFGNKYTDAFLERLNVLDSVQVLVLAETRVTEAGLTHLKGLNQLRTLLVVGPSVSDAFLDRLQELSQIRHLCLSVSQLGNADLERLSRSKQLVSLGLTGTLLTDTEFFRLGRVTVHQRVNLLARLARLEKRDLPDVPLGDAGLVCLEELSQLQSLDLRGANVTDSGLRHLRGLSQLQTLDLSETQIADDGLTHLRGLTQLTDLDLAGTRITGDGLRHLGGLTRLRLLKLDGTEVTAPAVRRFKRALPRARIQPWTLVWGWDDPALDAGVHFTPIAKKILSALQERTRMEFIETPLHQVVAFLKEVHDIPIQLDEPRLRAAGITPPVPVTSDIKGIALYSALWRVLGEFGLTYVIGENALIITTPEEGQRLIRQGKIGAEEVRREFQPEYAYIVTVLQNEVRFQFTATPLEDVVALLKRQHGIAILIDQRALAAVGIRPDVRCTLDVQDVPLASALRKLLGDVGLTYVVEDEFILITATNADVPRGETRTAKQERAIAAIKRLGGWVDSDENHPGQPVTTVLLNGKQATDAALAQLAVLSQLEKLYLRDTQISDAGWGHLKSLRHLQKLSLSNTQVTDAGLVHLKDFTQLQELRLWDATITDAGLAHLRTLPQLRRLAFSGTQFTDAAFVHLQGLTRLQELALNGTRITDDGVKHLRALTQLHQLNLDGNRITDAALEHFRELSQLQRLSLNKTQVAGPGLVHLHGLKHLQELYLNDTPITVAAATQLKRALPDIWIEPLAVAEGWTTPGRDQVSPTRTKIIRTLRDETVLEFIGISLENVVRFLESQHEIPARLDRESLRSEATVPMTHKLRGITLASALRLMLGQLGLTYVVTDEELVITTEERGRRLIQHGAVGAEDVRRAMKHSPSFRRAREAIDARLLDPIGLQFTDTPLQDVVASLEEKHHIQIQIDKRGLAAMGVRSDVRCTLDVKDVPLASALRKLLGDVGLAYVVEDEFILITAPKKDVPAKAPADPAAPPTAGEGDSEQAKVIAEIESLGGRVTRDESRPGRPVYEVLWYKAEFTDRDLERLKAFDNLQELILGQVQVAESKLTRVPDLSQLQELWLMQMKPGNAFLESLQQLPKLETLYLARSQVSDANLRSIGKLGRLKSLKLGRTQIPSASLAHLSGMFQLETLALGDTRVRDADLKHLRQLSQLKKLSFDGTFTTAAGLEHLAELAQLSELNVGFKQIGDVDIVHLSRLARLTALDLSRSGITDAGLGQLAILPQLTRLSLPTQITDAGLKQLRRATRLEVLHPGNNITDAGLANLSGLTRLEELTLGSYVTDAGLENLSGLTRLKTLRISRCKITEDGLKHLRGLTRLVQLDLPYKMPLSDTGLAHLGCLTQLERLKLRGSSVTDEGLRHLRAMSQLVDLDLEDTDITDAGLVHVRGLTKLADLKLANTKVAGAGLAHLRRHGSLKNLYLSGTSITDESLAHLQGFELRHLNLANTRVTDAGVEHLGRLKSLLGLDLSGTGVTNAGLAHLNRLRSLGGLNLSGTRVTDAGLAHLRGLTKLNFVNLAGTQISDEGLRHLAGLKALEYLYLGKNVMGSGLAHLRDLSRPCWVYFGRSDADLAAVRRFKKERPDVRIVPRTLVWGWDNPARSASVQFTQGTRKILAQLEDDTRLELIETPLTDVLAFLQDQHAIRIQLDEPRLRASGIGTDVPVTQEIKGITLHNALRLFLSEWGLTYVIRDDALVITTKEEARRLMQQGVINAEEVEREFAKERQTIRAQREAKTVNTLMEDTRCEFAATPLAEAVALLNGQHGILIEIDHAALATASIRSDVRCTANMKNVPLATALRKLLGEVGLTYVVHGELILITAL